VGPITIFDKSFLQSLSLDEAVWFDNFFYSNITPLFFVETLADLEKAVRAGRTPEREVGIIADKTPELKAAPNMFHLQICTTSLMGYETPMRGQIVVAGGKPVKTADQSGIVYEESPEAEAFGRWQRGEFLDIERQYAKLWRRAIKSLDLKGTLQDLETIGLSPDKCRTLEQAKAIAESFLDAPGYSLDRIQFVFNVLDVPPRVHLTILQRWADSGFPPLRTFAPYAAYVLMIEVFFHIAVAANLISREKVTNKIDLAYLFYLPFCMVFVSSDNFHKRCSPLFLRDDQEFVWGPELKSDLQRIDQHYDKLPESEKEKGLFAIASYPPREGDFLVARLWDRFLPTWRKLRNRQIPQNEERDKTLVEHTKKIAEANTLRPDQVDFDLSNPDSLIIKRKVRRKRGKWWQVPKDLETKNN
jgi:hypothetical protein